jgi:uncharacterized damage-inducible protein DinB
MAMHQCPALGQDARMTPGTLKGEVLELESESWRRTSARLVGLTDDELLWEPVQPAWTVRPLPDGTWVTDWAMPPPPRVPFATIAWRIVHLIGCYGSRRNSDWLDVTVALEPIEDSVTPAPHTAAAALAMLEAAHDRWIAVLDAVTEASLARPIGPIGGGYGTASRAGLVFHQLDEVIHHAAEVAVLRDLYRAQHGEPVHDDPAIVRLLDGDDAYDDLADPSCAVSALAELGRMDLVELAVGRGLPPDGPAPTALHRAAALGRASLVEVLLAAGADPARTDPRFQATPAQWAGFFQQPELEARLSAASTSGPPDDGAAAPPR